MKNNRGFTLVEVISIIALLGLIIGITVPSIMGASTNTKKKTLQTKVDNIEKAAVLYGQNHRENFTATCNSAGQPCEGIGDDECKCYEKQYKDSSEPPQTKIVTTITVSKLLKPFVALNDGNYVETNIDADEKEYINADDESGNIYNSVNDSKLNDCQIQIYKKYGKIYAVYLAKDTEDTNCWYK